MGKKNLVKLHSIEVVCSPEEAKQNQEEFKNYITEMFYQFLKETNRI